MSKNIKLTLLTAMAVMLSAGVAGAQQRDTVPLPRVCIDSVMKHIVELSSDTYEGRLAGSQGHDRAMRYVERVLQRYGVQPVKDDYGRQKAERRFPWQEEFSLECNEVENAKFNIYMPGSKEKRVFTLGNEFCCAGMTGRGYVDAQMVFCGYGVDNGYFDEYGQVDVKGKIAVVLTGVPEGSAMPERVAQMYVALRDKARAAERHGAIGMLVVNTSRTCESWEPQGRIYCGELPHMPTFPVLQLTLDCGREVFHGEKMELDSAIAALQAGNISSFALLKKAEVDINARYRPQARTANVVGILEGGDAQLKNEIIVVGASLDGLGMQGETCLFPSADINASGVAAVLETARLLSDADYRPRRSVAFVLFSGSEQQYLGSRRFIADFPKLRRVEAFVGAQNIGGGDSIVVLGGGRFPTLYDIAWQRDTMHYRQHVVKDGKKNMARGDARAFEAVGIPSLMITTQNGMHNNHVTTDIWENIDRRILGIATTLMVETVAEVGEGLYQGRSPQSRALRVEN
ncbi:MAG: M28 family peptidase [Bacteroidales bacterium]|nr:M28 family peptidase [Bacteroidales bacterium]